MMNGSDDTSPRRIRARRARGCSLPTANRRGSVTNRRHCTVGSVRRKVEISRSTSPRPST